MTFLQSPRRGSRRAYKQGLIILAQFPVNCLALSAIIVPCVLLNSYFFLSNVEIITERLLEIFFVSSAEHIQKKKKDLNTFKAHGSYFFSLCIFILISAFMFLSFAIDMSGRFMAEKVGLGWRKFCSCIYSWATVPAPIKRYVKE